MLEKHFVFTVRMNKAMCHLPVPVPAQHWPCKFQLHLEVTAEQKNKESPDVAFKLATSKQTEIASHLKTKYLPHTQGLHPTSWY